MSVEKCLVDLVIDMQAFAVKNNLQHILPTIEHARRAVEQDLGVRIHSDARFQTLPSFGTTEEIESCPAGSQILLFLKR